MKTNDHAASLIAQVTRLSTSGGCTEMIVDRLKLSPSISALQPPEETVIVRVGARVQLEQKASYGRSRKGFQGGSGRSLVHTRHFPKAFSNNRAANAQNCEQGASRSFFGNSKAREGRAAKRGMPDRMNSLQAAPNGPLST